MNTEHRKDSMVGLNEPSIIEALEDTLVLLAPGDGDVATITLRVSVPGGDGEAAFAVDAELGLFDAYSLVMRLASMIDEVRLKHYGDPYCPPGAEPALPDIKEEA